MQKIFCLSCKLQVKVSSLLHVTMAFWLPSSSSSSNHSWLLPEILLFLLVSTGVTYCLCSFSEFLKNADFESPPSNFPENSNKTSVALLTFALAPGGHNCSLTAPLQISAPDSDALFSFSQHYGKQPWEVHGVYLGSWGDRESVNLEIMSQSNDSTPTCWPAVDSLHIKTMGIVMPDGDNLVVNGGFEYGPDFLESSEGGVLLDSVPTTFFSPLIQWAILGKVRYINSKHFFVPQGNTAVELVSGVSSGLQAVPKLQAGSSYTLSFTLGDANDSCKATFLVGAQAGLTSRNFTLESNGTGSAAKFSMTFTAGPDVNTITLLSYTTSQTKDGDFCGPVIDDVILRVSRGLRISVPWKSLISLCLITIVCFF